MGFPEVKQKIWDHFYIAIGSLFIIRSGLRIRVEHREGLESDPGLEHMVVRQEKNMETEFESLALPNQISKTTFILQ